MVTASIVAWSSRYLLHYCYVASSNAAQKAAAGECHHKRSRCKGSSQQHSVSPGKAEPAGAAAGPVLLAAVTGDNSKLLLLQCLASDAPCAAGSEGAASSNTSSTSVLDQLILYTIPAA